MVKKGGRGEPEIRLSLSRFLKCFYLFYKWTGQCVRFKNQKWPYPPMVYICFHTNTIGLCIRTSQRASWYVRLIIKPDNGPVWSSRSPLRPPPRNATALVWGVNVRRGTLCANLATLDDPSRFSLFSSSLVWTSVRGSRLPSIMSKVADTKLYDILGVSPSASENELKKVRTLQSDNSELAMWVTCKMGLEAAYPTWAW